MRKPNRRLKWWRRGEEEEMRKGRRERRRGMCPPGGWKEVISLSVHPTGQQLRLPEVAAVSPPLFLLQWLACAQGPLAACVASGVAPAVPGFQILRLGSSCWALIKTAGSQSLHGGTPWAELPQVIGTFNSKTSEREMEGFRVSIWRGQATKEVPNLYVLFT